MMTAPTKPPSAVSKNEEAIAYDTGDVKTRTEFLWDDMMIQPAEAVMANSHNDEMQHKPLWTALHNGLLSIEVDVWLKDGLLLVGHEEKDLDQVPTTDKTLDKVYLEPLKLLLDRMNGLEADGTAVGDDWKGLYERASDKTLTIMIDMKDDGEPLWHQLVTCLQPLYDRGYLTSYADFTVSRRPLTIIGTGSTPIDFVASQSPRYVFYDAPLVTLSSPHILRNGKPLEWDRTVSPMASAKFPVTSYWNAYHVMKAYQKEADRRGIQSRWWGVVRWPGMARRRMWEVQTQVGVGWINADDLEEVATFLREKKKRNGGDKVKGVVEDGLPDSPT